MPLSRAKSNWYNNLSDFDFVDDFTYNNSPNLLTADTRNAGTSNGQTGVNDPPRSGLYTLATGTNAAGGGALGGNIGYVFSGWARRSDNSTTWSALTVCSLRPLPRSSRSLPR